MYMTCYGTGVLCLMSHRKARGRDEDLHESPESVIVNGAGRTRPHNECTLNQSYGTESASCTRLG